MQTLTYGMKVPASGDKGSVWFPALEDNFTALDAHNHNGTNSVVLTTTYMTSVSDTIHASSHLAVAGKTGLFSQDITMLSGMLYVSKAMTFRDTAGSLLFLQTEALTATNAFTVYTNDSAHDIIVYYGV